MDGSEESSHDKLNDLHGRERTLEPLGYVDAEGSDRVVGVLCRRKHPR
jgi:hypothetical protein